MTKLSRPEQDHPPLDTELSEQRFGRTERPSRTMTAIAYERYGSPDVLELVATETPVPKADEILVRVYAVEATKADCELRGFRFAVQWFWLPLRLAFGVWRPRQSVLGGYFAGVVVAVGRRVKRFSVGDQVAVCSGFNFGGYAQYACVSETGAVARKPDSVEFSVAAASLLGGLNALHYLRRARVTPGERVLINGAGGSIGAHAIQIAKNMGGIVTGVDAGYKQEFVRGQGADHFIDYTERDFTQEADRYDVIFDMVAQSSYRGCLSVLKPRGRYLKGNPRLSDMLRSSLTTRFTDKQSLFNFAKESADELEVLMRKLERKEIRSIVDRVLPLAQAPHAHELVESEQRCGAIVLTPP